MDEPGPAPAPGVRRRTAILHIGMEKTGTTTLQQALARSTDALTQRGFRYPLLGAGNAHAALVARAKTRGEEADLPALAGRRADESRAAFDARIDAELAREVAAHPDATFILSSEHASSRLNHPPCIRQLKAVLDRHFDDIRICVYLRRWDRMALSAYSTFVQNGLASLAPFQHFRGTSYLDYTGMLARWAAVFGPTRMQVAIFERSELAGGSIVPDFAARFGLPMLDERRDANASLDFDDLRALALINRLLEERNLPNASAIRAHIIAGLRKSSGPIPIAPDKARQFNGYYTDQAETIRALYFPERPSLFDDDYSGYQAPDGPPANWQTAAGKLAEALDSVLGGSPSLDPN